MENLQSWSPFPRRRPLPGLLARILQKETLEKILKQTHQNKKTLLNSRVYNYKQFGEFVLISIIRPDDESGSRCGETCIRILVSLSPLV